MIAGRYTYVTTFDKPRQLENVDVPRTRAWLESYNIDASTELVHQAIKMAAEDKPYHPVLTMLDGLTWNGTPLLDTWMHRHLGVEDTPLHRAYSARFLISMIARVREPGCKVDTVPIFEGPQGLQRSSLLQALAEPWFTDHVPNLDSKDAQLQLHGVWLVEFAEYGNLGKADANRAKNFITTQVDRLRKPYGEVVEEMRRQSVMAVTLNPEAHPYLKDATGNRRLWPVLCGAIWEPGRLIDLDAFRRERNQLLAEADHRYKQGEWWWLHEADLIRAHGESVIKRVDGGPLLESVSRAVHALVEKSEDLTFRSICSEIGLFAAKDLSFAVQRNIGQALTLLGYRGERREKDGVRQTFYRLIEPATGRATQNGLS